MIPLLEPDSLSTALEAVDNLEESLLGGLTLTQHGYAVELRFEHLRLGKPVPDTAVVTVVMEAVHTLQLNGALSQAMIKNPDRINWGLSEVAKVTAYSAAVGVGLRVSWENAREIRVEATRAFFEASPA